MQNDYITSVTKIGPLANEMLEQGMVIMFDEGAPSQVEEISVIHTVSKIDCDVRVGDTVVFGEEEYKVTAVGDEANRTLKSMGHCTFVFTGKEKAELPGQIVLLGENIPKIEIGNAFIMKFRSNEVDNGL